MLNLRTAFRFPLDTPGAPRDLFLGALFLLVPGWGWVANLGHRVVYTHRMVEGKPPFPAWSDWQGIHRHGLLTLAAMTVYHTPGALVLLAGWVLGSPLVLALGGMLWLAGTALVPGFMTAYCIAFETAVLWNPMAAWRRIRRAGWAYAHAWGIVLLAMMVSFLGLFALGFGFLLASVWFWQVAAYAFFTVFRGEAVPTEIPT